MMMLLCLVMGTRLISLDSEDMKIAVTYSRQQTDGSILLCNDRKIFHIDKKGRLIRVLDGAGHGPEQFSISGGAVFDGTHYYILGRFELSIYSRNGEFRNKRVLMARWLLSTPSDLFMVDIRAFSVSREDDRSLVRLTVEKDLTVKEHERFGKTRKLIEDLKFNFKNHFILKTDQHYYVMDEVSNEITQFSSTFQRLSSVKAILPGYTPPKCCFPVGSAEEKKRFLLSQSYICLMTQFESGLAISYSLANENDQKVVPARVQIVDAAGKPVHPYLEGLGTLVGSHNNELYFINEDDNFARKLVIWSKH